MNVRDDRRGMTLVELAIVTLLGAMVLAAMYQVLVTNQRTYAVQNSQVRGQQTLRAGLDLLTSELREISPADGDLVDMSQTALRIRAPRGLGLVCSVITRGTPPTVQVKKVGNYLKGDSARVYYENHPSRTSDDEWRTAVVVNVDSTGLLTCPGGSTAQSITLENITLAPRPDSFTTGAPVRNFVHYEYYLGDYDGRTYLMRLDPDGFESPVAGPLDPTDGVEFEYLDATGATTNTAADVREIRVTLRTAPSRRTNQGGLVQDSLTTSVYTRNTSRP